MKIWSREYADAKFRAAMIPRWFGKYDAIPCPGGCGCGITKKRFVAAHVFGKKAYPNLRWWPTNVLPLCQSCHDADPSMKKIKGWCLFLIGAEAFDHLWTLRLRKMKEAQAIEELKTWA